MLLNGIRVVEAANFLPAPYCGFLLRSMGATVTKVEPPTGDPGAAMTPVSYRMVNEGKRIARLDLKTSDGRAAFEALIRDADAFVVSYSPKAIRKLGFDASVIRAINPRIVHASLTGYGMQGPYADFPGHDVNYQAIGGNLRDGETFELPLADLYGGNALALAVCAALVRQRITGEGAELDIALTDAIGALASFRTFSKGMVGHPAYGVYECSDGKKLALGCFEEKFFEALFRTMAVEGAVVPESWYSHAGRQAEPVAVDKAIRAALVRKPRDHWIVALQAADAPATPVLLPTEVTSDPHMKTRGFAGGLTPPFRTG